MKHSLFNLRTGFIGRLIVATAAVLALCVNVTAADFSRQADCHICGISFPVITETPASFSRGLDGRPMHKHFLPPAECPLCGGVFADKSFSAAEIKKLNDKLWAPDYQQLRRISTWHRHAVVLEILERNEAEIAEAWLRASWSAEKNSEQQKTYLQLALRNYLEHLDSSAAAIAEEAVRQRFDLYLKIGDIYRQLGRFSEAQNWFARMMQDEAFLSGYYPMIINFARQLAGEANSSPARVPDGNELHQAVISNDAGAFALLSKRIELLNEFNLDDLTPLMLAMKLNRKNMTADLISAGSDLKRPDSSGKTALHLAAALSDKAMIPVLLSHPDFLNLTDNIGRTPLHYAAIAGNMKLVDEMLKKGADLQIRDRSGNSILHLMALHTHDFADLEIARKVAKRFSDLNHRNFNDYTPFQLAAISGNELMAGMLASAGANVNARIPDGRTALFFCRADMILYLLELGVKYDLTNNLGQTAFVAARLAGEFDRVRQFKMTRAHGRAPVLFSIENSSLSIFSAVRNKDPDAVKKILEQAPEQLESTDAELGETPLHMAIVSQNPEMARLLLQKGAKLSALNDFLRTPLHYAAARGNLEVVKLLCEAGADIFALDARGSTPLHDAAAGSHRKVYDYLIKLGASDSTLDNEGVSPSALLQN